MYLPVFLLVALGFLPNQSFGFFENLQVGTVVYLDIVINYVRLNSHSRLSIRTALQNELTNTANFLHHPFFAGSFEMEDKFSGLMNEDVALQRIDFLVGN